MQNGGPENTSRTPPDRAPVPVGDPTLTAANAPRSTTLPERIGRYHIKRIIASGGMGTVYEATQDNPRRVTAA